MIAALQGLAFLLTIVLATACVTGEEKKTAAPSVLPEQNVKPDIVSKEGQKTPPVGEAINASVQTYEQTTSPTAIPAEDPRLQALLQELSDPSLALKDESVQEATKLHPARPLTAEQAVLVTAQLRLLKLQLDQNPGFFSKDLYDNQDQDKTANPRNLSLESQFQTLKIDLLAEFQNNGFLKNPGIYSLCQDVLDRTQNSDEFYKSLSAAIATSSPPPSEKATVDASPTDETQGGLQVSGEPVEQNSEESSAPAPEGNLTPAAADLKTSDLLLLQAQKLADKGDYKGAIIHIAQIGPQDPFADQAKEKGKLFSNRAVQDLRQKAAEAFQSSLPLNDPRAKQAYLNQAKRFLDQALKDFPDADQLDTVRENLAVITRELELIQRDLPNQTLLPASK